MKKDIAKALFNSYSYIEYQKLIADLVIENKTSGSLQSEDLVAYTKLNQTRMLRLDKTIKLTAQTIDKLKQLNKSFIWLVISETWCGDAAQILPALNKMAIESKGRLDLRIVLRDDNEDLMNQYLTKGARSIPKVIMIGKETSIVRATWGPRPRGASDLIEKYLELHHVIDDQLKTDLQLWYLNDKTVSIQQEIINELENIEYQSL